MYNKLNVKISNCDLKQMKSTDSQNASRQLSISFAVFKHCLFLTYTQVKKSKMEIQTVGKKMNKLQTLTLRKALGVISQVPSRQLSQICFPAQTSETSPGYDWLRPRGSPLHTDLIDTDKNLSRSIRTQQRVITFESASSLSAYSHSSFSIIFFPPNTARCSYNLSLPALTHDNVVIILITDEENPPLLFKKYLAHCLMQEENCCNSRLCRRRS